MSDKELNADDILAESDGDFDEDDAPVSRGRSMALAGPNGSGSSDGADDNGDQASGGRSRVADTAQTKKDAEERKEDEARDAGARETVLNPQQLRDRSGAFVFENQTGGGTATRPADDSGSDGGPGRGRTGGFVMDNDPEGRQGEPEAASRQRSGAWADEVEEDDGRLRSGGISLSSDFRKPKDDTSLQDVPGHADPEMMHARRNSLGRMTRTFTVVGNGKEENQKIFAENLNIAQSPAKVDIDKRSNSKGENEDLLDDIMNESDDSSSQDDKGKAKEEEADDGAKDQKKGTQKSKGASDKEFNEDDEISEGERRRILEELEDSDDEEGDDDDDYGGESDSDSSDDKSSRDGGNKKEDDSMSDASMGDLANKSIDSGPQELQDIVDKSNYLPFISQKYEFQNDVLEVIDKNERSFKMVAEQMIQKSSQLDYVPEQEQQNTAQRRLMHFKEYNQIAYRFHGDAKVAQGVPYCMAALENIIAIGSSDGSVRLFDNRDEQELKALSVKEVKQNPVYSVDIKRVKGQNLLSVVAGHSKGQLVLYEIKGLARYQQSTGTGLLNNIQSKHIKTITDVHEGHVVQVKFFGEFARDKRVIQVISCDITGCVYLSKFTENVISYSCAKQCFWRKRLAGPSYVISPLYYNFDKDVDNQTGTFNQGSNPYDDKSFAAPDDQENLPNRNHLIAFGALERIVMAQVAPTPMELFCIERPDYVDPGIVPYLDWGQGLSPVYRDSTYPMLAITWGRTVQLAIWTNFSDIGAKPEIKFDGFYICDGFSIDQCFFLDESLLFVLINKKEVKILYTQRFSPGVFDEKILQKQEENQDQIANKKYFLQIKEKFTGLVSTYAEVDKGYRLVQKEEIRHKDIIAVSTSQLRSKFNFHPTICKNFEGSVLALGKTTVCQGTLIHWEEYLDLIRRTNPDDWLKVLRAAVDIFNGKMVGLAGLPDQKEAREYYLRESMKDLLRENIDACIKEFQEGQMIQSKTLRVATEFCIKVGAIDHLFGELFNMFAEAGIEQRYFENLEAFILSGKLKHIVIPPKILTRIIQYYRQKDVELLEKSILNLNLDHYPNNLEVRHICEEDFLTSALIHMLTTIFDKDKNMENTVCLHILCALYNVMNKSKIEKTKEELITTLNSMKDSTILFEANQLEDKTDAAMMEKRMKEKEEQQAERQLKLEMEHSKTYIGYKLMWVIQLFLEGKKFPTGTLSAFKWRMYVFDIVRFITTSQFLRWFLHFDPQRFFKLILALYINQEPYQYISTQKTFVEMYRDEVAGLEECASHLEILNIIHKTVKSIVEIEKNKNNGQMTSKCELLENSFMFFISRIGRRGHEILIESSLITQIIIKQLQFHRKLLKLDINIEDLVEAKKMQGIKNWQQISQAIIGKNFIQKPEIEQGVSKKDKPELLYKYLVVNNEKDVLKLVKLVEDQVAEDTIKDFCTEADSSPMYMVRVYLHEYLHNYQKCLQMFFKIKVIKENVFAWLQDIQANILAHNDDQNISEQMQQLILKNISSFIEMNAESTVKLCDQWFEGDYYQIVQAINKYTPSKSKACDLCFNFINTVLELQKATIMEEYKHSTFAQIAGGSHGNYAQQNKFKDLIIELTRIVCKKKYRKNAMDYVQREYFPIEDCLKICEDKGVIDACAVLYKRKGEYQKSISLYIQVLTRLSKEKVISAVYVNADIPFNDPEIKNASIKRFDEIMTMIIDICDKEGSRRLKEEEAENLWLSAIEMIYQIKQEVTDELQDLDQKDLNNFHIFLLTRIQAFMMRMAEYVSLEKIINFLQKIGKQNTYSEFQPTFEEKVKRETYNENILNNATDLILKDIMADSGSLEQLRVRGCVAQHLSCHKCSMPFINKWDKHQVIQMFKCGHNFHQRCVAANKGNCTLCFNEHDEIKKIIQSRSKLNSRTTAAIGPRAGMQQRANASSGRLTAATSGSESEGESPGLSARERGGAISSRMDAGLPRKLAPEEPPSPVPQLTVEDDEQDVLDKRCQLFEFTVQERDMFIDHYM